jgi:hypothetical protein
MPNNSQSHKKRANLQDIWRESLHGNWRIFHLPAEGNGAVRRSSRDDFELYSLGPRRNCWRQVAHFQPDGSRQIA